MVLSIHYSSLRSFLCFLQSLYWLIKDGVGSEIIFQSYGTSSADETALLEEPIQRHFIQGLAE